MNTTNVVRLDGTPVDTATTEATCVVFKNKGELDLRAIRTMGISAKQEGSIGFFGTGLKYAIAVLLREAQELVIYSGTMKLTFEKKPFTFRDKSFEIITMNGEELPFTTELGKTWEVWQAFRELYCNCTDEAGQITKSPAVEGEAGYTVICASGEQVVNAFDDRGTIILGTHRWTGDDDVAVHRGATSSLFYKGVRVYKTPPAVNTYNVLKTIDLTEDRTLKYWWQARGRIINTVLKSTNKDFIQSVLTAPSGTYESEFNFTDTTEATATPSAEFMEVCESLGGRLEGDFNSSARQLALNILHANVGNLLTGVANLSDVKSAQLTKAMAFCETMGYPMQYPVIVTDVLGQNVLALAEKGNIYLNIRCFALGTKKLVAVLIEEYLHLKHGLQDETREMQNFLFEKIVDMAAEQHGEVL